MKLSKVFIKNYRNFLDEEININKNSLIIGPNDVGKTNLLRAIRIVLDKTFSSLQLEPEEKDFNIFSSEDEITITLEFDEIDYEEQTNIYAKLGKFIKDEKTYITYKAHKHNEENYCFYIGHSRNIDEMTTIPRQSILNAIHCVYLDSSRDLKNFLKKAKISMMDNYKKNRNSEELKEDEILVDRINENVDNLNDDVENISYIRKSTKYIMEELSEISDHNNKLDIRLSSFNDVDDITKNVELVSTVDGKMVEIGGDGRSNQIYMSMWIKDINETLDENNKFVIFLIEEPEAHLHFPLQAMTIRRLIHNIKNQLIVSSHSPKIVTEFEPISIIRLYFDLSSKTKIANNGCSESIGDELLNFGYRNNLINGEMFFSNKVLLVEGPSEVLLYKNLALQLEKDIEKFNICIVAVDGVGFESYVKVLKKLEIPFSVRTDNDIFKLSNGKYFFSGINRLIKIYNLIESETLTEFPNKDKKILTRDEQKHFDKVVTILNKKNLFLSKLDLEKDLVYSQLNSELKKIEPREDEDLIKYMQKKKATNMFDLIYKGLNLECLQNDIIFEPLKVLIEALDEAVTDE